MNPDRTGDLESRSPFDPGALGFGRSQAGPVISASAAAFGPAFSAPKTHLDARIRPQVSSPRASETLTATRR